MAFACGHRCPTHARATPKCAPRPASPARRARCQPSPGRRPGRAIRGLRSSSYRAFPDLAYVRGIGDDDLLSSRPARPAPKPPDATPLEAALLDIVRLAL